MSRLCWLTPRFVFAMIPGPLVLGTICKEVSAQATTLTSESSSLTQKKAQIWRPRDRCTTIHRTCLHWHTPWIVKDPKMWAIPQKHAELILKNKNKEKQHKCRTFDRSLIFPKNPEFLFRDAFHLPKLLGGTNTFFGYQSLKVWKWHIRIHQPKHHWIHRTNQGRSHFSCCSLRSIVLEVGWTNVDTLSMLPAPVPLAIILASILNTCDSQSQVFILYNNSTDIQCYNSLGHWA